VISRCGRTSDDEVDNELDRMCNGLLGDDGQHPQLSPLPVIDKSALADDVSIVGGMSHDIDDVVDSVINTDDLPPLADLSELAVLPLPPTLPPPPASEPQNSVVTTDTGRSASMPQSAASDVPPGVTYDVSNEPAVLVRLRRLTRHRYSPVDTAQQRVDVSPALALDSVSQPQGVVPSCKSGDDESLLSDVDCTDIVKQQPILSTSNQTAPSGGAVVSKRRKSVSAKRGSGTEKSLKSAAKTCVVPLSVDDNGSMQSAAAPVDAVRSAALTPVPQAVTESVSQTLSKPSKSVKRKSDAAAAAAGAGGVSDVKKQRTDVVTTPTPDVSNMQYVITNYSHWLCILCSNLTSN